MGAVKWLADLPVLAFPPRRFISQGVPPQNGSASTGKLNYFSVRCGNRSIAMPAAVPRTLNHEGHEVTQRYEFRFPSCTFVSLVVNFRTLYAKTSPCNATSVRVASVFCTVRRAGIVADESTCLRSIRNCSVRSICRSPITSTPATRVDARPSAPARPVRPTR